MQVAKSTLPGSRPRWLDGTERLGTVASGTQQRGVLVSADGEELDELTRMVRQLNYRVDVVGQDAFGSAWSERPVAAILSGRSDPTLEVCAQMAQICPVIMVSDDRGFDFRLSVLRAGATAVVRDPVNATELSEWLSHFGERSIQPEISVLIVDDDRLAAEINAAVLRSSGMLVTTASDPASAVRAIEDLSPDIVLMDMQMPSVDGVELARVVRQSMHFVSLPIIFLSAERDEDRQIAARRLGGDDFIHKPVPPDRLIALVRLRAERSKRLRNLIERDRLTGLLDHTRFEERLTHELERCRRTGAEVSLAMIDVDFFKRVNDQQGHQFGDDVLRTLARLLGSSLRKIDVVGRCGGEEFGVILLDTGPNEAARVLRVLKQRFGDIRFRGRQGGFAVTFSAGVASSLHWTSSSHLLDAADTALYAAKSGGRNLVRVAEAPHETV